MMVSGGNAIVTQQLFSGRVQFALLQIHLQVEISLSLGALSGFASAVLLQPREEKISRHYAHYSPQTYTVDLLKTRVQQGDSMTGSTR